MLRWTVSVLAVSAMLCAVYAAPINPAEGAEGDGSETSGNIRALPDDSSSRIGTMYDASVCRLLLRL